MKTVTRTKINGPICLLSAVGTDATPSQTGQVIKKVLNKRPVNVLQEMSKADRDAVLHELKMLFGKLTHFQVGEYFV